MCIIRSCTKNLTFICIWSQDLERGLEKSGKTHAQEVKGLRARNRALASEAVSLRDNIENLHSLLKVLTASGTYRHT